jgi:mono/diheme cytochrome c family protein
MRGMAWVGDCNIEKFAMVLCALFVFVTGAAAETLVERGSYLVNAVMGCDSCHTPRGRNELKIPSGPNTEQRFSGGIEVWETPAYIVRGTNITTERDTGIGSWSEDDIKRLLTEGIRPNGVRIAPQMPYGFYKILTPGDLDAIARYLKTIEPVRNKVPPPVYKTPAYQVPLPGAEGSIGDTVPSDPVSRGFYLGTLAYCMACHSRRPDGVLDFKNWWGKGGFEMKGLYGSVVVSNISSHKERGVGALTDAELKRVLTEGIGHDGRLLKLPMARQTFYSKMTEQDLDAIIAWLRTIPPIE